jgi:hypothetical protein
MTSRDLGPAQRSLVPIKDSTSGYGALMEPSGQPVATGRKWDGADNRSNKRIRNRWQPTATVPKRMVKRGSTVRRRDLRHCCRSRQQARVRMRVRACLQKLLVVLLNASAIIPACRHFQFISTSSSRSRRTFNPKVAGSIPARPTQEIQVIARLRSPWFAPSFSVRPTVRRERAGRAPVRGARDTRCSRSRRSAVRCRRRYARRRTLERLR